MRIFIRSCLFILITLLILYGAVELALLLVAFASSMYAGYEYMFMGFCVDCYFAPEPYTFWYTLVLSLIVVAGLLFQPFIRTPKES
jgi:hypothetical protein